MSEAISRFSLLRGDLKPKSSPVRPPWARPDARLLSLCDSCGECLTACPEGIVRAGPGGIPELDFSAGLCSLCGACAQACPTGALADVGQRPFPGVAQIASSCLSIQGIACRLCEEHCEPRAIRFRPALGGRALPEIEAEACTGCGACAHVCPAQAVTFQETSTQEIAAQEVTACPAA